MTTDSDDFLDMHRRFFKSCKSLVVWGENSNNTLWDCLTCKIKIPLTSTVDQKSSEWKDLIKGVKDI